LGGARGGLFVKHYNVFVQNPSTFNGNFYLGQHLKCYIVEYIVQPNFDIDELTKKAQAEFLADI